MATLYMLIGLPGSGKSFYAKSLSEKTGAIIHSSDAIREELLGSEEDQSESTKVFELLHCRVKKDLGDGRDVIYDATNINSKRRRAFLQELIKYDCKKIAIFIATPYEKCLERNNTRNRKVPEHVIKRMYMSFNVPCTQEGFDEVRVIYPEDINFVPTSDIIHKYYKMSQDNPHHTLGIGEHAHAASEIFLKNYLEDFSEAYNNSILYAATLMHDMGKPFTKTFVNSKGEETSIAHYYNHNNVGAYEVFFVDIPEEMKIDVALLIQYHMNYFISWKQSSKVENRDRAFLGERLSKMLDILHACDVAAH